MTPSLRTAEIPAEDPRLFRAAQEYLADLEAGRRPDRLELLRRYPDLASELAPYLDSLDLFHASAPLLSPPNDRPVAPEAAEPLGDFRIVREIGRGGMGVVYEAVQLSLGRRVALKVLSFASALDARQLQRFKNEAQAAAALHHTNIVPVFAVGCERGVHYYAMQLIEGQTLAEFIAAQQSEPPKDATDVRTTIWTRGEPAPMQTDTAVAAATMPSLRPRIRFRVMVELAIQAAEALEHAHGLGVIHRDVKPGNLLVDGRGKLWVTDFGLAQFQTSGGLTQSGDLLGTLRYMSPEQAGGTRVLLDHRTDVYSLGATLYELLTLKPIFDGGDSRTLLRQILHDEPRAPRTINPSIPAELQTIVRKALAKSPADRYASAQDLADDLRRFNAGEPIKARPATFIQRTRRWLLRYPAVTGAAVVLLAFTALGFMSTTWLVNQERAKAQAAYESEQRHAEEARQQAARAEENLRLVNEERAKLQAAYEREERYAERVEQGRQHARHSVDWMIKICEEGLAGQTALQGLRVRLLEKALADYQEFIKHLGDDPRAQAEAMRTQKRVGEILADLALLAGKERASLLNIPSVRMDLRLSDKQTRQVEGLSGRLRERLSSDFRDFGQLNPEEREKRFVEIAKLGEEGIKEILDVSQLARLRQIDLQMKGLAVFQDPEVETALKLTTEQMERLRALEGETNFGRGHFGEGLRGFGMGGPGGPGGPGPGGPGRPGGSNSGGRERKPIESFGALNEKIEAILNPEQLTRWRGLIGKPLKNMQRER